MIEFGRTLREAREAKGFSISQIAEMTHMMSSTVQDLENENFTKIPAPIYGRGFVKLYCEAVGLDAKPMVAEFMEILNGNRTPSIKERISAPQPPQAPQPPTAPQMKPTIQPPSPVESIPEPKPVFVAPEPKPEPEPELAFAASEPEPEPVPTSESEPEPPIPDLANLLKADQPEPAAHMPIQQDLPTFQSPQPKPQAPLRPMPPIPETEPEARSHSLSRYSSPLHERNTHEYRLPSVSLPPNFWRLLVLGAIVVIFITCVCLGIRALYRATTTSVDPQPAGEEHVEQISESAQPSTKKETAATKPAQPKKLEQNKKVASAKTPEPSQKKTPPPTTTRIPQQIPQLYFD